MTARKIRKLLRKILPIETKRLIIRQIEYDDAYDMYDYASREEVCKYLLWSPYLNVSAVEGYIEYVQKRYLRGLYADWAVALKENNRMIGTCGFVNIDTLNEECEVGYVLSPDYWGNGYMTEALEAVLQIAFIVFELNAVKLRIINENTASKKLAERSGFKLETVLYASMEIKGEMRDIAHYKITKEEYCKKNEAI